MGMADFYFKIRCNANDNNLLESIYQIFDSKKLFRVLHMEGNDPSLTIECKFDNIIPSLIIAYEVLSRYNENIATIETHGTVEPFTFNDVDEFVCSVFLRNKEKLLSYYKQMGYLAIPEKDYYKRRNKLKEYYQKLI